MSERTSQESPVDGDAPADADAAVRPADEGSVATETRTDIDPANGDQNDAQTDEASAGDIEIDVSVAMEELGGRRRKTAGGAAASEPEAAGEPVPEPADEDDGEDPGDDEACPQQALAGRVEALLFASDRPLTERRLATLCGLPAAGAVGRVREALHELDGLLRASGRSFRPRKVAGGWQLVTLPAFGPLMARLHRDRQETRLSPAAMETLSIIAYRQPVLRAELEAIRGVACGEVLRSLLERRMISIVGRSEDLGRPMLYGTTRQFLEVFGLSSLEDLPVVEGLERRPPPPVRRATPDAAPNAEAEAADEAVVEAVATDTPDDADAAAPVEGVSDETAEVPAAEGEADAEDGRRSEAVTHAAAEEPADAAAPPESDR